MSAAQSVRIGETIRKLRVDGGFKSRASLVGSRPLKGKITQEGLRKIEAGERVPKLETLRRLTKALGASETTTKMLEDLALRKSIERVTRRVGNVKVRFSINGRPMDIERLPPKKKTEAFVRKSVSELMEVANTLGLLMEQDEEFFRLRARSILIENLSPP